MDSDVIEDKRVLDLATQVTETTDRNVPNLLLGLQNILDSLVPGSAKSAKVKLDIWKYELLHSVLIALKQDFSLVSGKWNTAAALAKILCQASVGIDPQESHEYYGIFLPDVIERLLILSRNIQHRYIKIPEHTLSLKDDLIKNFRDILDQIKYLVGGHPFLATNVLRSNYLLQMMITEDIETSIALMNLVQSMIRASTQVLSSLDEKVVFSILDELVYKLSAFTEADIGAAASRALLAVADVHQPMIQLLYSRYKGLRPLLSKWTGKGFGRDLKKLLMLLDAGSAHQAEMQRMHRAATTIQAVWKSFRTRKQLKKANKAMKTFQRSFRGRQENKQRRLEEDRIQRELHHQLLVAHRRTIRETRQKQLNMIAALHPSEVNKYLEVSQIEAAIKIQARWKGVLARKKYGLTKATAVQVRAAIMIQRAARKFLDKLEAQRNEVIAWRAPPGLTDERRVEIQEMINKRKDEQPAQCKNMKEVTELHDKAQEMLTRHLMLSRITRQSEQRREALLAQLKSDADLIINSPKVKDATERDLYTYMSRSLPIATKAKENHLEAVKRLQQPWWKKLDEHDLPDNEIYQEEEYNFKVF
ncbi:IQ calmodulin-binding motif-containing protein 1-like [Ptychodera flava]|uniref:IQ calmodulin-binding motif-containing protein 1-like n=1 Tax=Ptychodera flava TaxID=63121 RepID=UPI00396A5577